jgi:hypothetical protein
MNGLDVILDQLREAGVPEQSIQAVALTLRPPRADFQRVEGEAWTDVGVLEVERFGIRTEGRGRPWVTYRRLDSIESLSHCAAPWEDWVEMARGILASEGERLSKATPP